MLKRILPWVLTCSMMISVFSGVRAFAASEETDYAAPDSYKNDIIVEEPDITKLPASVKYSPGSKAIQVVAAQFASSVLSLSGSSTYNFSSLLDSEEILAYNMMKITAERILNADGTADSTINQVVMDNITDVYAVMRAYCAFIADNPEYFWLYSSKFYELYDDESGVEELVGTRVDFGYCYGYSESNVKSYYNNMMSIVNSVVSAAEQYSTDYEKIKFFATYLSDKTTYNNNAANSSSASPLKSSYKNCWNAYGSLVDGNGVCEAYAEGFKLLCDTAGIPCISVYSHDHEWNAVKLDGSWYYVDVTWIDTDKKSTYQYDKWLAVGTSSAKNNDNSGGSHTPVTSNIVLAIDNLDFSYPSINTADYERTSDPDIVIDLSDFVGIGVGSGSTGSSSSSSVSNKNVSGSVSYKFTVSMVTPSISVTVPSSISAVINPYGVPVSTNSGDYGSDGVTSPVYTIRNKTQSNAVSVSAETYLTVPKDKSSGEPTIMVCDSPNEVKSSSEKALSAYLLASVSESAAAGEASESEDLIRENNVQYTAGDTLVFADATIDSGNSNRGTLMVLPKADYVGSVLQGYYYGHFKISGAVTDMSKGDWGKSDKVTLVVIFNIVPCADP